MDYNSKFIAVELLLLFSTFLLNGSSIFTHMCAHTPHVYTHARAHTHTHTHTHMHTQTHTRTRFQKGDSSASGSVETEQDDPISMILVGSKKI